MLILLSSPENWKMRIDSFVDVDVKEFICTYRTVNTHMELPKWTRQFFVPLKKCDAQHYNKKMWHSA